MMIHVANDQHNDNNHDPCVDWNLPDHLLSIEELARIEKNAIKQKHLAESDKLDDVIKSDEEKLKRYNVTFEQLDSFFDKLKSHYRYQINYVSISDGIFGLRYS